MVSDILVIFNIFDSLGLWETIVLEAGGVQCSPERSTWLCGDWPAVTSLLTSLAGRRPALVTSLLSVLRIEDDELASRSVLFLGHPLRPPRATSDLPGIHFGPRVPLRTSPVVLSDHASAPAPACHFGPPRLSSPTPRQLRPPCATSTWPPTSASAASPLRLRKITYLLFFSI